MSPRDRRRSGWSTASPIPPRTCSTLAGLDAEPVPYDQAVEDGFSECTRLHAGGRQRRRLAAPAPVTPTPSPPRPSPPSQAEPSRSPSRVLTKAEAAATWRSKRSQCYLDRPTTSGSWTGYPDYHRASCSTLVGLDAEPVPHDQAVEDGFTELPGLRARTPTRAPRRTTCRPRRQRRADVRRRGPPTVTRSGSSTASRTITGQAARRWSGWTPRRCRTTRPSRTASTVCRLLAGVRLEPATPEPEPVGRSRADPDFGPPRTGRHRRPWDSAEVWVVDGFPEFHRRDLPASSSASGRRADPVRPGGRGRVPALRRLRARGRRGAPGPPIAPEPQPGAMEPVRRADAEPTRSEAGRRARPGRRVRRCSRHDRREVLGRRRLPRLPRGRVPDPGRTGRRSRSRSPGARGRLPALPGLQARPRRGPTPSPLARRTGRRVRPTRRLGRRRADLTNRMRAIVDGYPDYHCRGASPLGRDDEPVPSSRRSRTASHRARCARRRAEPSAASEPEAAPEPEPEPEAEPAGAEPEPARSRAGARAGARARARAGARARARAGARAGARARAGAGARAGEPEPEPHPSPSRARRSERPGLRRSRVADGVRARLRQRRRRVWVVDGRPRYHAQDCLIIKGQKSQTVPLRPGGRGRLHALLALPAQPLTRRTRTNASYGRILTPT